MFTVRIASFLHVATIDAWCLSPVKEAIALDGEAGTLKLAEFDTTHFLIYTEKGLYLGPHAVSIDASSTNLPKIPQTFCKVMQAGMTKTANMKNSNMVLQNVSQNRDIRENISFEGYWFPPSCNAEYCC